MDDGTSTHMKDDRGVVAIWVAIMFPVIFILCAIAVDISRWYVEIERAQKAADAAALSGVPFLPSDPDSAITTALRTAAVNGFPDGANGNAVSVTAAQGTTRPTQLTVKVRSTIDNAFASLFGLDTQTISRSATADFQGPVPMGSPCNVFGREDMEGLVPGASRFASGNCDPSSGTYWVNIAGKNTNKARGDGYASGYCTRPDDGVGIDACTNPSGTPAATPGTSAAAVNTDFNPDGYTFVVRAAAAGEVQLQGYDLGWVATGDTCNEGLLAGATTTTNAFVTTRGEATLRYQRGNTPFCPGDTQMAGVEGDGTTVQTIVTVRGQSSNPFDPLEGPVLCTQVLDGWNRSTPISALADPSLSNELARTHHRWANVCSTKSSFSMGALDDFSIQVRTVGGGGQNRFGLRAVMASGPNENLSIFAAGRVSLFNNVTRGISRFNLVRLGSSTAGYTLNLRFFDLGDATDPVEARVLQPDSSTPFVGCRGEGPVSTPNPLNDCGVSTRASTNGGRWQTIRVPVPPGYRCSNDRDQSKCWVRIELSTGASQADTTTWQASLDGDPVRIVQ